MLENRDEFTRVSGIDMPKGALVFYRDTKRVVYFDATVCGGRLSLTKITRARQLETGFCCLYSQP
jgi:hypothetical protein